tara:strand:- start:7381 stop:7740 length:360 start_codon:yes stop_codon:yes gene_type:complete
MAKKEFTHKDLSPKELELLKETYVELKIKSMDYGDLRDFANEHISLQIKSTIGDDEELEAWQEMEEFLKEDFEDTIKNIKIKIQKKKEKNRESKIEIEEKINSENKIKEDSKKLDMWED